ncbi:hypothetical protein EU538_11710 [Candidatus Thorarchaeota archaeon]|nr:MAG: hypothetical protein EU538_11710 [Candidatus Thorarchaeota archaeon]
MRSWSFHRAARVVLLLFVGLMVLSFTPFTRPESEPILDHHNVGNLDVFVPQNGLSLAASSSVNVSGPIWSQRYGGADIDEGHDVVQCADGGFCIVGETWSFGAGYADMYVVRTDSEGNLLWNSTLGYVRYDYGVAIVERARGDFIIAGGSLDPSFNFYGWLVCVNSTGGHKWNKTFTESSGFRGVCETEDGGILLAGGRSGSGSGADIHVMKTDENATKIWSKWFGTLKDDQCESLYRCADGDYLLSGISYAYEDGTHDESWLLRLDPDGIRKWFRVYGTDDHVRVVDAIECADGGYLAVGQTSSRLLLLRTDSSGYYMWESTSTLSNAGLGVVPLGTENYGVAGGSQFLVFGKNGEYRWHCGLNMFSISSLEKCSNGECVAAGMASDDCALSRIPWLAWNETPIDRTSEYGQDFEIDLNATLTAGLHTWTINDTSSFQIDQDGVITNGIPLSVGGYPLQVSVNDTVGNTLIQEFTLTVEDTTAPSWLESPVDRSLEVGEQFRYDLNATDASGIASWSVNATTTFAIDDDGIVTNKISLPVGAYGIHVAAADIYGTHLTAEFTVEVVDTQGPTWITPPSPEYGFPIPAAVEFECTAHDLSGIDSWSCNDTDGFSLSITYLDTTSTCTVTASGTLTSGTYGLNISVTDSHDNEVYSVCRVTVEDTDSEPPVWVEMPEDQWSEYGETLKYNLNATDPSGLDTWWVMPEIHFTVANGGLLENDTVLAVGVYSIIVYVNDTYGNTLSSSFTVHVEDTRPPTWLAAPEAQSLEHGELLSYQLKAWDLSGVGEWWINDTAHFLVDSSGCVWSIAVLEPGTYGLQVVVSDIHGNEISAVFTVTVNQPITTTTTTTTTTSTTTSATSTTTSTTTTDTETAPPLPMELVLIGIGIPIALVATIIILRFRNRLGR